MTDLETLKRLALSASDQAEILPLHVRRMFQAAANPEAILELIERLEVYEAALRFYALRDHYVEEFGSGSVVGNDNGELAREALEKGSTK